MNTLKEAIEYWKLRRLTTDFYKGITPDEDVEKYISTEKFELISEFFRTLKKN
jgi:hypothetical protein